MRVSSRTFMGRSASLLADKDLASVVVRLMMAMNDLGVANSALAEWERGLRGHLGRSKSGECWFSGYARRLQCSCRSVASPTNRQNRQCNTAKRRHRGRRCGRL
jgi:hypothetical protein